jgi:hypothetical protein
VHGWIGRTIGVVPLCHTCRITTNTPSTARQWVKRADITHALTYSSTAFVAASVSWRRWWSAVWGGRSHAVSCSRGNTGPIPWESAWTASSLALVTNLSSHLGHIERRIGS